MNESENITNETSFEDFQNHIVNRYLTGDKFQQFLDEYNSPYSQESIRELFQDTVFTETIRKTWDHQRSADWPKKRDVQITMSEALIQGMTAISIQVSIYQEENKRVGQLKEMSPQEVEMIKNATNLLIAYFRQELPLPPDFIGDTT